MRSKLRDSNVELALLDEPGIVCFPPGMLFDQLKFERLKQCRDKFANLHQADVLSDTTPRSLTELFLARLLVLIDHA